MRAAYRLVNPVVPGRVPCVRAKEAPRFIIVAQQAQRPFTLTANAPIRHSNGEFPTPLNFPVEAATGQGVATEHLGKAVEALWTV